MDLFESILGEDEADRVQIDSAFRVDKLKQNVNIPRDVVVKFSDWTSKWLVISNFRQHGKLIIDGLEVQAFPDLAPVTL